MKIIAINLTDNIQSQFIDQISKILNTKVICLNYKDSDSTVATNKNFYTTLSLGALTLEQYVIDNLEYNNPNKSFINALMFWQPSLDKIYNLQPYIDVLIKNWLVVQEQNNPKWIFGNISTLSKWAGSLYKIDKNDFYLKCNLENDISPALVYAGRIGITVQGFV